MEQDAIAQVKHYRQQAAALLLYQSVLDGDIGKAWVNLLDALIEGTQTRCAVAYGRWFSALANQQQSWQSYLYSQILQADNAFAQQAQRVPFQELSLALIAGVQHDLDILQNLHALHAAQMSQWVEAIAHIAAPPAIEPPSDQTALSFVTTPNWNEALPELANYYCTHGVGLFGQFLAFRWQNAQLIGIPSPDSIKLTQLAAYEHPKQQLTQNTETLLKGYPAQNVLLYGSRGAGKSSLVKALLNEYHSQGLRLIEVPKADLHNLPQIVEKLRHVPQKFIIFVDDLSFEEDDEAFKALKVVLEGGVTARPQNVVVYATSNRRHLVREFFEERPAPKDADEIQAWDTIQEKLSFSDRFGLTLTFTPADQPTYLTIVRELAAQAGLTLETEHLEWRARQWATRHNGRSGRTARQFVDFLIAEQSD
ncbi:MAG: ATP-binding protein [Cyanobacteria bacterium P01_D01_bin.105]